MANSYNLGGKYFDIDSADADVDGLNALKGSDPASGDTVYISEGYRVTVNRNCSLLKVYLGDNKAGTAAAKTGHLIISASTSNTILTLFDTILHGGLTGQGTTSTIALTGVSDSIKAILNCNTVDKVSNNAIGACKITAYFATFKGMYLLAPRNVNNTLENVLFDDCFYAYYADTVTNKIATFKNVTFQGCFRSIHDAVGTIDWLKYFAEKEIKLIGNALGSNSIHIQYTSPRTRFLYYREDAASIKTAPAWNTTTGIQSLTANKNATLTALWNTAAHGTGDTVGYRIYIRNGAAPNSFGISSPYFLAETRDTSFIIACNVGGDPLAAGDTYYVVVRAATDLSDEDSNTAVKNSEVVSSDSEIIRRIDRVTGTILALTVSRE